jgi:predicted dehydrogenase
MDALHSGRRAEPGLEVGAQVQRVAEAARASSREGRFVRIASIA